MSRLMDRSRTLGVLSICLGLASGLAAQSPAAPDVARQLEALQRQLEEQSYAIESLEKRIDDVLWFDRVGDVAEVDKVYIPTVPAPKEKTTYGIANERHPFRMWSYVFIPRSLD